MYCQPIGTPSFDRPELHDTLGNFLGYLPPGVEVSWNNSGLGYEKDHCPVPIETLLGIEKGLAPTRYIDRDSRATANVQDSLENVDGWME